MTDKKKKVKPEPTPEFNDMSEEEFLREFEKRTKKMGRREYID